MDKQNTGGGEIRFAVFFTLDYLQPGRKKNRTESCSPPSQPDCRHCKFIKLISLRLSVVCGNFVFSPYKNGSYVFNLCLIHVKKKNGKVTYHVCLKHVWHVPTREKVCLVGATFPLFFFLSLFLIYGML